MELLLNGQRVDLAPDTLFAITVQSNDITKPDSVQSSYSNTLTLPFTEHNHGVLENANEVGSQSTAPYRQLEALVLQDGVEVVPLPKAYLEQAGEGYELQIFSGSIDFFQLLGDKSIRDLDLSRFNFHWGLAAVMQGAGINRTYADGYIYQLRDDGGNIDLSRLFADQLYPAVFVRTVFEQLFTEAGVKYTGFADPLFDKLTLPFSNATPRHTAAWVQQHSFEGSEPYKVFTSPFITFGKVSFEVTFEALVVASSFNAEMDLYIDSTKVETQSIAVTKVGLYTLKVTFDIPYLDDLSRVKIGLGGNYSVIDQGTNSNKISQPYYKASFSDEARFNTPWDISVNLPDISQKDFFKAVMAMFNLMPSFDPYSHTMRLVPMQQLEANKAQALDWSSKLVYVDSQKPALSYRFGDFAQRSIFKYKDEAGSGAILVDDQQLEQEKVMVELPFAGAVQGQLFMQTQELERTLQDNPKTSRPYAEVTGVFGLPADAPAIGALYKVNRGTGTWPAQIESNWILCMHVGNSVYTVIDEEIQYTRKDTTPRISVVGDTLVNASLYTTKASVSFAEHVVQFRTSSFQEIHWETLLTLHHQVLRDILDRCKGISPYFMLNAQVVQNYDCAVPVWLDQYQSYFYLNAINEFTGEGPTECLLWRL